MCPNAYRCKNKRHIHKQSLGTQELTEAENYSIPVATMLATALCLAMVDADEQREAWGDVAPTEDEGAVKSEVWILLDS